jgi:hypothetical protein
MIKIQNPLHFFDFWRVTNRGFEWII